MIGQTQEGRELLELIKGLEARVDLLMKEVAALASERVENIGIPMDEPVPGIEGPVVIKPAAEAPAKKGGK